MEVDDIEGIPEAPPEAIPNLQHFRQPFPQPKTQPILQGTLQPNLQPHLPPNHQPNLQGNVQLNNQPNQISVGSQALVRRAIPNHSWTCHIPNDGLQASWRDIKLELTPSDVPMKMPKSREKAYKETLDRMEGEIQKLAAKIRGNGWYSKPRSSETITLPDICVKMVDGEIFMVDEQPSRYIICIEWNRFDPWFSMGRALGSTRKMFDRSLLITLLLIDFLFYESKWLHGIMLPENSLRPQFIKLFVSFHMSVFIK